MIHRSPCQTLSSLQRFPRPMDRAEVLHAPNYDISGRRKNTPGENELVLSAKSQLFHPKTTNMSRSTCHSTCPLPQRVLLSKRTSRLYESLPCARAALLLRQQAILRVQSAPAAWKSLIFMKFEHLSTPRVHPCKP